MPKAKALKNYKIVNEVKNLWRLVAVGNGSKTPLFDFFSAFAKGISLRYGVILLRNLMRLFTKKSFYHQWFFAVKRRVVFILGAKWKALVRGWRRDCVVGGMETRFQ